jgi:hypothetical protein
MTQRVVRLRDELLKTCQRANIDVNEALQALGDAIIITLILAADDMAAAQRVIDAMRDDMRAHLPAMWKEYRDAVEPRRAPMH